MEPMTVCPLTKPPLHHFFGYYDKSPWDASGRYVLGMASEFMDREPTGDDPLRIGLIDLEAGGTWKHLAETPAWCWQTGCMLQWVGPDFDRFVVYNHRRGDRFIAVVQDVFSGEGCFLDGPVHAVNAAFTHALTLNYSRLDDMRPGYGYRGLVDEHTDRAAPDDDGVWRMDIGPGGKVELIVSFAKIASLMTSEDMRGKKHWFNHMAFNPSGTRFAFLHRWAEADAKGKRTQSSWGTRLFTANLDGTGLHLFDTDGMVSHYDWRDDETILAWARVKGVGDRYFLFTDRTQKREVMGEGVLTCDGHCSYDPGRGWVLTDTYPDADHKRTLILYDPAGARRIDVGKFYSPPDAAGPIRCDLHPRWRRDGRQVCVDSAHEGTRQMYALDVSEITAG